MRKFRAATIVVSLLSTIALAGCGGGDAVNSLTGSVLGTGPILYPDDGISNNLFGCNAAASRIQGGVELGMSKARIRAIVGKPRHISPEGEDWRFGTDSNLGSGGTPEDFIAPLYYLPATNFKLSGTAIVPDDDAVTTVAGQTEVVDSFLDDFSGDVTLCDPGNADLPFIEAANSYTQVAGDVDFSQDVPVCYDAAVRIAASVEQGMSLPQVRALVGKPIEVAIDGTNWRYQFGAGNSPYVFFTQYDLTGAYYVTGYSSIITAC